MKKIVGLFLMLFVVCFLSLQIKSVNADSYSTAIGTYVPTSSQYDLYQSSNTSVIAGGCVVDMVHFSYSGASDQIVTIYQSTYTSLTAKAYTSTVVAWQGVILATTTNSTEGGNLIISFPSYNPLKIKNVTFGKSVNTGTLRANVIYR